MGRWLAATALLAGALAAGAVAFLNGGEPLPIRVTPGRTIALPLGTALGFAFAAGAALVAMVALGAAVTRASRRWSRRRRAAREHAAVTRERVRAEQLIVGGEADAARARLADAVGAHGHDERLLELLAGASEQSGDVAGAIAAVEDARTRLPASPLLARRLCTLYAAAGRWDEALELQAQLIGTIRSPDGAAAEIARSCGFRFEAAAADPDATRGLRRLLALAREHPGFVAAWVTAGDRLRAGGRLVRARRVYERGARGRPAAVLLERLAALDADAQRPERTTRTLERLRRHHPRDAGLAAALVRHHLQASALDRAEAVLSSWPGDAPAAPTLEALRGECSRRRGQSEQAAEHLARAAAEYLDPRTFHCRVCRHPGPAWSARCTNCGRWDTMASTADAHDVEASGDLIRSPRRTTAADHCVTETPG